MTSDRTTVTLSRDTIEKSITSIIHHPNKEAIARLIFESVMHTVRGEEYLVKFLLGEDYPEIPAMNSFGFINVNDCWMDTEKKTAVLASPHYENGLYPCEVKEFHGLSTYNQITVRLQVPGFDDFSLSIKLEDFIPHTDDF